MIPCLHLVTDDEILSRDGFLSRARDALVAGGDDLALHLRGPGSPGRLLCELGETLAAEASAAGARLLVNDRIDVAMVLDLTGVHLGQRSLSPSVARALLGPDRLLGLSVHGPGELRTALSQDVDFFIAGTIFPSASHPGASTGGLARIRVLRGMTSVPLLAIGGMTPGRVQDVRRAGSFGVAVRSGVWDSQDPGRAVEDFLSELKRKSWL